MSADLVCSLAGSLLGWRHLLAAADHCCRGGGFLAIAAAVVAVVRRPLRLCGLHGMG